MFNIKKSIKVIFILFLFLLFLFKINAYAQILPQKEEYLEGKITQILEEKQIKPNGSQISQLYQKLKVIITKGSLLNKEIIIEHGNIPQSNIQKYKVNDEIIINSAKNYENKDVFYITGFIRRTSLTWLFLIFVILTVLIARIKGIFSIIGMGISFFIIFSFILPKILEGYNPVEIAILGSFIIIPVTFLLSHGFNKKTLVAISGTIIALIITGVLSSIFVDAARLTGFASEESSFLQLTKHGLINMKGLLLAGIIIGVLGVLDDITISQSAIVFQLKEANYKLGFSELYKRAMNVGQDHISSMVNTLVLVYTGAALPLLLLFIDNTRSFSEVINFEIIADEIVRTLIGSIGLILAVPITTFIACIVVKNNN